MNHLAESRSPLIRETRAPFIVLVHLYMPAQQPGIPEKLQQRWRLPQDKLGGTLTLPEQGVTHKCICSRVCLVYLYGCESHRSIYIRQVWELAVPRLWNNTTRPSNVCEVPMYAPCTYAVLRYAPYAHRISYPGTHIDKVPLHSTAQHSNRKESLFAVGVRPLHPSPLPC